MIERSKSEIVRRCFEAYRTQQRAMIEELLAEDFTFTSPYDDAIDRATYFRRCWPTSEYIRGQEIEAICECGEDVFVLYKVTARDGREFRNTEYFSFARGQVRAVNVFFGATYKDGVFVAAPAPG